MHPSVIYTAIPSFIPINLTCAMQCWCSMGSFNSISQHWSDSGSLACYINDDTKTKFTVQTVHFATSIPYWLLINIHSAKSHASQQNNNLLTPNIAKLVHRNASKCRCQNRAILLTSQSLLSNQWVDISQPSWSTPILLLMSGHLRLAG